MTKRRILPSLVLSVMIVSQFGWMGLADAAKHHAESSESPSVSASPSASPTPTPSASPSVSLSPSPSVTATPSPSSKPRSKDSEDTGDTAKKADKSDKSDKTGPDGCGGVVPGWVFDTVAQRWVTADKASFVCDKSGYYLSPKYNYNKQSGWYTVIVPNAPKSADLMTVPETVHTAIGDLVVGSKDYEVAKSLGLIGGSDSMAVPTAANGSGSSSTTTSGVAAGQNWADLTNMVNVLSALQSKASSGDVAAKANTQVGDISTGTVSAVANIINLLASAWSWSHGDLNFFMRDFANYVGDLTLNPTETPTSGGGVGTPVSDPSNHLNVNAKSTGSIVNDVNVDATSGAASASKNTEVGNVSTGNASAQVNILNLINSMISSGSSFFGILNFFGNFNGDILFPNGFLNGSVPSSGTTPSNVNAQSTNTTAINNNIDTSAASGNIKAASNTQTGDAASGTANTQQGVFNMANSSIFGDNAVLVIVNVLGHWIGKIMTIPGGSTSSALLTGNAQSTTVGNTGAGSSNGIASNGSSDSQLNQSASNSIANNVKVNAQSGDADVTKNTGVGSIKTGDAQAASNTANIVNSVLNVKHWFGVLVINVFGSWIGDVNNDTSAGNTVPAVPAQSAGLSAGSVAKDIPFPTPVSDPATNSQAGTSVSATLGAATEQAATNSKVLTAAAQTPVSSKVAAEAQKQGMNLLFALSALIMLVAGALFSIDKKLKNR